jgi:hypothetical protein
MRPYQNPPVKGFVKGYEFDLKKWDKSDFFCPETTLHVFFTERVKQALEKNKITNFGIRNIADCEWYSFGKE